MKTGRSQLKKEKGSFLTLTFALLLAACSSTPDQTMKVKLPYSAEWSMAQKDKIKKEREEYRWEGRDDWNQVVNKNYTVTVTDASGCYSVNGQGVSVSANMNCNGCATVTASGGTAGYTYCWSPTTVNNGSSGTYSPSGSSSPTIVFTDARSGGGTGRLTAGEINDFAKWKLWSDISSTDLGTYQHTWHMRPMDRYLVQLVTKENKPVIDAEVKLVDANGGTEWKARTDNTGKAELWSHIFAETGGTGKYSISISAKGNSWNIAEAKKFPGINHLDLPLDCDIPNAVDLAFVVDATSSMSDEIDFLKNDLNDIIGKVSKKNPELKIRTAALFYRCPGNSFVTRHQDFTLNTQTTINYISGQTADEGGDEVVETALDEAVNLLSWNKNARSRIIFHVLDEPPGRDPAIIRKMQKAIEGAAANGIRIVPVVCSGEGAGDKELEYLMRTAALATNGTYTFLTDDSGIGNTHTAPTTDEYKVEKMNELIQRVIKEFTYAPKCDAQLPIVNKIKKDTLVIHPVAPETTTPEEQVITDQPDQPVVPVTTPVGKTTLTPPSVTTDPKKNEKGSDPTGKNTICLNYYPNPTNGPLTIDIEGSVGELFIADISGKLMVRYEVQEKEKLNIDLSEFPAGIYYITYLDGDQARTGKVILVH